METIQMSSSLQFKIKLKVWANQAGMTVSEFVRTACIYYAQKILPTLKDVLKP